jgi:hygromycin-B 4-O-kinase
MMENLLSYCPNDRYLVHGGYGFGNLLVVNGRVTAVLDWLDAKYGDFVYDVAWLDFWDSERGYRELFQAHYAEQGTDVSNLERRLLCYQGYIALDGMRFFAKSDNADAYKWTRDHILSLITT